MRYTHNYPAYKYVRKDVQIICDICKNENKEIIGICSLCDIDYCLDCGSNTLNVCKVCFKKLQPKV